MSNFNWISWENNTFKRLVVGLAILATVTAVLSMRLLTVFTFDAFVMILVWIAVYEIMRTKKTKEKGVHDYYIYPYLVLAYLVFLMGILLDTPFPFWLHLVMQFILVLVLAIYVYFMSYTDKDLQKRAKINKTNFNKDVWNVVVEYLKIIVYPALLIFTLIPLNHMARWAYVDITARNADGVYEVVTANVNVATLGLFALLLVFVITMMSDTFAYITGKLLKGPKLCPKISPNKTVSGFCGALFGGVVGAMVVVWTTTGDVALRQFLTNQIGYLSAVMWFAALVGLLGAAITHAGDIYASWLKRKNNVKDFGKWLPGHGGVMDRLDGLIMNAMFIFIVMMFVVFVV